MKRLYQATDFAANETVAVVGPAAADDPRRAHPGPVPQVQPGRAGVHRRDQPGDRRPGPALGRHRGDARLPAVGPKGSLVLPKGVIRAERHVHMGPKDADVLRRQALRPDEPAGRGPLPDDAGGPAGADRTRTGSWRSTSTPTRPTAATCRTRPRSRSTKS